MTRLNPDPKKAALALFALTLCLFADAHAQKRQAIVIMRPPGGGAQVAQCDGTMDLIYQLVSDVKLNNKEEVRMAGNLGASSDSASVPREVYEKTQKTKLRV